MADNFVAESVASAGEIFATDQDATSSAHYPYGKIVWGVANTFNITSTSAPFPVQLFGNGLSSSAPTFVGNNSAHPVFVRGMTDSGVTVNGTVTVNALTSATKIQTEPVTSSANRTFVDNNSGHPIFVRGLTNSAVDVTGTVTVGAVTAGAGVGLNGLSSATGALLAQTLSLSSLAQTVLTAVGRLYGYSVSNPDTAANVWFHIYPEDSAGVTLGTSSALINQMAPFGGGREASWPQGVLMSSGMSLTASATAPSTVHDAPATTITITVYYTASS